MLKFVCTLTVLGAVMCPAAAQPLPRSSEEIARQFEWCDQGMCGNPIMCHSISAKEAHYYLAYDCVYREDMPLPRRRPREAPHRAPHASSAAE